MTKYAAVALANVATNQNRSEFRHSGTGVGTSGCAIYGTNGVNYITFDGLFTDMAEAPNIEDSGVIRVENGTGVHFRNFEIKGTARTIPFNPVIYRPGTAVDTILSNFRAYDFSNSGFQGALFSDQYGDQNFLIEHFEIRNTNIGIFTKAPSENDYINGQFNHGTIRYGIISDNLSGIRLHALHPSIVTNIHHVLIHTYSAAGIHFSQEVVAARNVTIDHVTMAVGTTGGNQSGAVYIEDNGVGAVNDTLTFTNSILDNADSNFNAREINDTWIANYNGYYRGGSAGSWSFNGTTHTTIGAWRTATGEEANSTLLSSDPFTNRAADDFTIAGGHAALTASSTGGEIGAYEGNHVIGVDVTTGTTPSRFNLQLNLRRASYELPQELFDLFTPARPVRVVRTNHASH